MHVFGTFELLSLLALAGVTGFGAGIILCVILLKTEK